MASSVISRWIPGAAVAAGYRRAWLWPDVRSGLVLTALLIPAGMGYATVAGLPPVTGLYATIVPLVAYAVFGPSRILVLGPDSALAPIIAATILPLAHGDPDRAVALAGLLAILVGACMVIAALLRLGVVTELLSKPVRVGYLNAIALVVIVAQLPALLGIATTADAPWARLAEVASAVVTGDLVPAAAALGVASLATILVMRRLRSRVPGVLVVVVLGTAATWALGLEGRVAVVGALPQGLPAPALTGLVWADVLALLAPAAGIALVAFTDTAVLSRSLAARRGEEVDGSDELRGMGLANIASGTLGGFPISGSSSRTPVAEATGSRTQLTGIVGAGFVLLFVLLLPGLTAFLPDAVLAAVVIAAVLTLIDARTQVRLWRVDRADALVGLAALVGVLVVGVLEGIVIALALSLLAFVEHARRPYRAQLGRVPGMRGYHDLSRHAAHAQPIPGLVIVRYDAPLFFANATEFGAWVRRRVEDAGPDTTAVILAAEPITDIDSTAVDALVELDDFLHANGITLVLAELKDPVLDVLRRHGVAERFEPDRLAPTVGAAVDEFTGRLRGDLDGTRWDDGADAGDDGPEGPAR